MTAGIVPRIWQQEGCMLMPRVIPVCDMPACAISPQQAGGELVCIVSTQAETGIAVHKTATASISNAIFLPQLTLVVSQVHL